MNFAKFYFDLIGAERSWSWAVIGIIYLVVGIFFRQLIFARLAEETKKIDPSLYSAATKLYLKNSLPGWIFFSISFLLVIGAWMGRVRITFEIGARALLYLAISLFFFLSMIFHLIAFSRALLTILRQGMGVEKEF